MVTIVSRHKLNFPAEGEILKIPGKCPLYGENEVLAVATGASPWTRKCRNDVFNLGFDNQDLLEIIKLAVKTGTFKGSEWCQSKPDGPWAACDAYSVSRIETNEDTERKYNCSYFVKFCISDAGSILLTVSCHL